MQFARSHVGADLHALGEADRTGVQPFGDAHDRDAALSVARHDGTVDGSGAPPARQERGMDIEGAVARALQNWRRQDEPIGHDNGGVGFKRTKVLLLLSALQPLRGAHGEPRLLGGLVNRRFARGHAPPRRAGRLCVDRGDIMARFENGAKSRHGEVGRAHEDDAHHRAQSCDLRGRGITRDSLFAIEAPHGIKRARARQEKEHRQHALLDVPSEQPAGVVEHVHGEGEREAVEIGAAARAPRARR